MLFMFHLLVGLLIGLVAFRFLKNRDVVLLAVLGSVLPDLIDKPLGYIFLSDYINDGRIYAHTGLFMLSVLCVGIVYRQRKSSWAMMVLALGVVSHLFLDMMWFYPVTLYYPFLGDFSLPEKLFSLESLTLKELASPFEWFFGVSALSVLLYVYRERLKGCKEFVHMNMHLIVGSSLFLLIVTGIVSMLYVV